MNLAIATGTSTRFPAKMHYKTSVGHLKTGFSLWCLGGVQKIVPFVFCQPGKLDFPPRAGPRPDEMLSGESHIPSTAVRGDPQSQVPVQVLLKRSKVSSGSAHAGGWLELCPLQALKPAGSVEETVGGSVEELRLLQGDRSAREEQRGRMAPTAPTTEVALALAGAAPRGSRMQSGLQGARLLSRKTVWPRPKQELSIGTVLYCCIEPVKN